MAESAVGSIDFVVHLKINLPALQSHGAIALMEIVWTHFRAIRKPHFTYSDSSMNGSIGVKKVDL